MSAPPTCQSLPGAGFALVTCTQAPFPIGPGPTYQRARSVRPQTSSNRKLLSVRGGRSIEGSSRSRTGPEAPRRMKTNSGRLTRPVPRHRSRLANLCLSSELATDRPVLYSPTLSAGHLLTPSPGLLAPSPGLLALSTRPQPPPLTRPDNQKLSTSLANRFLTSGNCVTSLTLSSTLPLHLSQSLSPKLPRALGRVTSASMKSKADQPLPVVESDCQPEAPIEASFSSTHWMLEDPPEVSVLMPNYNLSAQEYEDLEQARGALVTEELRDVLNPSENQDARLREKKEALLNGVCCSLIEGANFTDAQNVTRLELLGLCQDIANQEPEFLLKVALYTRQELNIRSTANFLLALSAWLPPCRPHLRRYFCQAVRLPSDWIEVAKIYQSLSESSRKLAPYPSCLRHALADSFKLFDEYQLAKYNTRKQRCKTEPRRHRRIQKWPSDSLITKWSKYLSIAKTDVKHLVAESSPAVKQKEPKVDGHFSLKKLIRWLHLKEPAYHIMCLLGRRYPSDLQSFARSRLPGPWDSPRAGERMKLQLPETWERQLSLHGNTVKGWEELIDHQKLPFMAMLRNLRNMIVAGMSRQHHERILKRLMDRNSVIRSRQFPFRFLSAYRVIAELQERLDEKDSPLPTREALVQKVLESLRLPNGRSRFLKPRAYSLAQQRRLNCISFIYRQVTKRLEELEKRRDVRYDQDLLERYRRALDTAIEISASHNVPPLPGHTVVMCCVEWNMNAPCITAKGLYIPRADTQGDEDEGKVRGPQASCSNDGTIRLSDPDSGECIRELKGHTSTISGVCIMEDLVLSVSGSGDLVVWKESGSAITAIHAHPHRINHLAAFSKPGPVSEAVCEQTGQPDQLTVATASDDGTVRLWNPLLVDEVSTLVAHGAPVNGAAAGDGVPFFLTVGADRTVRLWEVPHGKGVEHLSHHCGAVTALCWSPSGTFLISGSQSGEVKLWSASIALHSVQAHKNRISAIVFLSENNFAVGSYDKRVSIWTVSLHQQTNSVQMYLQSSFTLNFPTYYLSWLKNQDRLLVADLKGNITFWSAERGHWLVMESNHLCCLFSRVIERRDGSLVTVEGSRRTKFIPLRKADNPPREEEKEGQEVLDMESEKESEKQDTVPDMEAEKQDTESEQEQEKLIKGFTFKINPWGLDGAETVGTLPWLTVVKESGTTPGEACSTLCADSLGSLWRSDWDPTAIPAEESINQHDPRLSTWTHKQVHSDRVTAVTEMNDLIVTASYDRTVRLWDRESLKQVGHFTCQAPVLCLEVNPVSAGVAVCGDSMGNVYFLRWDSRPIDR
ncbi:uncharacterized protein [Heterodontus francisci]|uniref:uncharacterized protein n=1 Tax=Heterodontus francisci TaxID=7792 RepID=UPI00355C8DA0